MSEAKRLLRRVSAFFSKRDLDAELESELEAHLQLAMDEYIEQGLPPAEAHRRAFIDLGGMEQTREKHREARGLMDIDILSQDLRYTLRALRRDRGFALIAILILALAIGANIAVFSVVSSLMLRPLPFRDAQQLVWIAPPPTKCGLSCATYSTDAYDEFRANSRSYQDVTGYFAFSSAGNLSLKLGDAPVTATGIDVIANFFQLLGVQPAMGRLFTAGDARNGASPVILLTDAWWRRQFAADPNIIGKAFDINGQQTTVVGVLPASFDFGAIFAPGTKIDAITPLNLYGPPRNWGNMVTLIGRLKPGVSFAQAREDAARVAPTMCWNNRYPQSCGDYAKAGVVPVPLKDHITGKLRSSLVVLWSAVGAILLIACVNLSNLFLARAAARSKEFAMRGALGASRARIVRQLLTESLVLSGTGAIFGLLLALTFVTWLAHQGAVALPLLSTLHIDSAALGWTVLVSVSAAVFFGLVPGLRMAASSNLHESLKDAGPGASHSRKHERIRSALVISEVALACMLLVGAGLLLRSFVQVLSVELGFEPGRAAAVKVEYDDSDPTPVVSIQKRTLIFQQVLSRIGRIPGVQAAGIVDYLPLSQNRAWGLPFPKGVKRPDNIDNGPLVYVVTEGYMHAMGTRMRGRDFNWSDGPNSENVVMISASYAHFLAGYAHWPNNDPIGQIITRDPSDRGNDLRIIGVVDDVHEENVDGEAGWQIYYPATQARPNGAELVIRTILPPATLATTVLRTLRDINPKQPIAEFRPIQSFVDHANSPRRFFMLLVSAFAGLGLLLAALGIYGVISYSVTRQKQEIGIRMALGASASHVRGRVLKSTLRLAMIGIAVGALISIGIARLIASLLYATSPWDAATYCLTAATLLAVALLAGYVPALRASRISPLIALRAD